MIKRLPKAWLGVIIGFFAVQMTLICSWPLLFKPALGPEMTAVQRLDQARASGLHLTEAFLVLVLLECGTLMLLVRMRRR